MQAHTANSSHDASTWPPTPMTLSNPQTIHRGFLDQFERWNVWLAGMSANVAPLRPQRSTVTGEGAHAGPG